MGIQAEATQTGHTPEHGSRFQAKGAPSLSSFRRGFNLKRGEPGLAPTLLSFPTSQLSVLTAPIEFLATELQATHTMSHTILVRGGWV